MLYQIVEIKRGVETVKMVDTLPRCNNRIKELRSSCHGKKGIAFRLEESDRGVKFEAKPSSRAWLSGDYPINPPKIK